MGMESMKVHQNVWSRGGVSTRKQPRTKYGKAQKSSSMAISGGSRSLYVLMETSLAAMENAAVNAKKNQTIWIAKFSVKKGVTTDEKEKGRLN